MLCGVPEDELVDVGTELVGFGPLVGFLGFGGGWFRGLCCGAAAGCVGI